VNNKRPACLVESLESGGGSPSPKKQYPNYSKPESDGNSLLSVDDEEQWQRHETKMIELVADQNDDEDRIADGMEDRVDKEHQWHIIVLADGRVEEDDNELGDAAPPEYESIRVINSKEWSVKELKKLQLL